MEEIKSNIQHSTFNITTTQRKYKLEFKIKPNFPIIHIVGRLVQVSTLSYLNFNAYAPSNLATST